MGELGGSGRSQKSCWAGGWEGSKGKGAHAPSLFCIVQDKRVEGRKFKIKCHHGKCGGFVELSSTRCCSGQGLKRFKEGLAIPVRG